MNNSINGSAIGALASRRDTGGGRDGLVSVIIPVWNGGKYLREAVESVRQQGYAPLEIVIVDDGSTDNTAVVTKSLGLDLRYVYQPNAGSAAARNRGVALAHGAFLAFLDADDLWQEGKLQAQVAALMNDPGLEMVFGYVEQFHSPELDAEARRRLHGDGQRLVGRHVGAMLIRRPSFERVGDFDPDLEVAHFIDWYARAEAAGLKELVLPQTVMRRRLHLGHLGLRARDTARAEYLRLVLQRLMWNRE